MQRLGIAPATLDFKRVEFPGQGDGCLRRVDSPGGRDSALGPVFELLGDAPVLQSGRPLGQRIQLIGNPDVLGHGSDDVAIRHIMQPTSCNSSGGQVTNGKLTGMMADLTFHAPLTV